MDIGTMTSLMDQSMLLNYSYRNMYVKNILSSSGITSSGQTYKDLIANEKTNPTKELVKTTTGEDSFLTESTDATTEFKNSVDALSKSSSLKVVGDNVKGTAAKDAVEEDFSLNIRQLATSQVSGGKVLGSYGKDFTVGENTIELKVGDVTKNITFNVSESDTNKDSIGKMINAINKSGLDVVASVGATESSAKTSLVIKSKNTGTDNEFSIKDVKGNAALATAVDNVTQKATNASYSIDGVSMTSQSNNIKLQDGKVELTLSKADGNNYSVKVQKDTSNLLDGITKFVSQYNNMISLASENKNSSSVAKGLENRLRTYLAENYSALKDIGITYKSGSMTIDQGKLKDALSNKTDQVNNLFGNNGKLVVKANTEISSITNLQNTSRATTTYSYKYNYGSNAKTNTESYANFYDTLF